MRDGLKSNDCELLKSAPGREDANIVVLDVNDEGSLAAVSECLVAASLFSEFRSAALCSDA